MWLYISDIMKGRQACIIASFECITYVHVLDEMQMMMPESKSLEQKC